MKVLELKEKAKSLGIKSYYKMKKQELLDAIKEAELEPEPEPAIPTIIIENENAPEYKVVLKRNEGILEFPLHETDDRKAFTEFIKIVKSNKEYPLGELFKNGKKFRQHRNIAK